MASYYDEHDCDTDTPINSGRLSQVDLMELVRVLLSNGDSSGIDGLDNILMGGAEDFGLAPPASKAAIESLERRHITEEELRNELKCPVCLVPFDESETALEMPCEHIYHGQCILPWLNKTNSCPNCRHELPTDDKNYENRKKKEQEEKAREDRVKEYHDSMFG
uniref:E3 ubiquitin-protein ligase RNF181-like n=1 Tax=Styela clava TaxID=7725 RepID=UPI00193A4704|nr:E3 ubiquitin-protein ligase RNF181-like [Styela clava]